MGRAFTERGAGDGHARPANAGDRPALADGGGMCALTPDELQAEARAVTVASVDQFLVVIGNVRRIKPRDPLRYLEDLLLEMRLRDQ